MTEEDPKEKDLQPHAAQNQPTLTRESIQEAVRRSLKNAEEVDEQLRHVFELSDGSSSFRLR